MFRAPSPASRSSSLTSSPRSSRSSNSLHHSSVNSRGATSYSSGLLYQAPLSEGDHRLLSRPGSSSPVSSRSSRLSSPTSATSASFRSSPKPLYENKLENFYRPNSAQSRSNSPISIRPPSSQEYFNKILLEVFGDSFCSVFTLLGDESVKVNKFTGASARGLNNFNSQLQVGDKIVRCLATSRPRFILLQFGAVDIHINYLWQLKARRDQALGPTDFVHSVVNAYCSFLRDEIVPIANATGMKVYIAGVLPPVVEDYYLERSIQKYLQKSTATSSQLLSPLGASSFPYDLRTRHSLVKLFNHLVARFCSQHPDCLSFVNINKYLYSEIEPTRVSRNFVDLQDPTNIHLIWERTIQIWCREIPILRSFLPLLETSQKQLELGLKYWKKEKLERLEKEKKQKGASSLIFLGGR